MFQGKEYHIISEKGKSLCISQMKNKTRKKKIDTLTYHTLCDNEPNHIFTIFTFDIDLVLVIMNFETSAMPEFRTVFQFQL